MIPTFNLLPKQISSSSSTESPKSTNTLQFSMTNFKQRLRRDIAYKTQSMNQPLLYVVFCGMAVLGRVRTSGPLHQNISLCLREAEAWRHVIPTSITGWTDVVMVQTYWRSALNPTKNRTDQNEPNQKKVVINIRVNPRIAQKMLSWFFGTGGWCAPKYGPVGSWEYQQFLENVSLNISGEPGDLIPTKVHVAVPLGFHCISGFTKLKSSSKRDSSLKMELPWTKGFNRFISTMPCRGARCCADGNRR